MRVAWWRICICKKFRVSGKLLSSKKISEKYHQILCSNRNGNSDLILRAGYSLKTLVIIVKLDKLKMDFQDMIDNMQYFAKFRVCCYFNI